MPQPLLTHVPMEPDANVDPRTSRALSSGSAAVTSKCARARESERERSAHILPEGLTPAPPGQQYRSMGHCSPALVLGKGRECSKQAMTKFAHISVTYLIGV